MDFFFQAEDGIRDGHVTGVQTCALPISRVLTERLRLLEQKGFVYRKYESTIPPSVTYGITNRMKDIGKVLSQLERLARKWGLETASTLAAKRGPHKPPVTSI